MAVEQGFVNLITSSLSSSLPNMTGGFSCELPINFISRSNNSSWTYRSILSKPLYLLNGQDAMTMWQVQIDCIGFAMVNAIAVASAINSALSGSWSGTFTDVDSTVVYGIFRLPTQ